MPTFFHGWRRKLGVVTLVLACLFMAGWVRSRNTHDIGVLCLVQPHVFGVTSFQGRMELHYERNDAETIGYTTQWISHVPVNADPGSAEECVWDMVRHNYWESSVTVIPYWSIVIPLTLLSAYLLLSKPRVAKPPPRPTHV